MIYVQFTLKCVSCFWDHSYFSSCRVQSFEAAAVAIWSTAIVIPTKHQVNLSSLCCLIAFSTSISNRCLEEVRQYYPIPWIGKRWRTNGFISITRRLWILTNIAFSLPNITHKLWGVCDSFHGIYIFQIWIESFTGFGWPSKIPCQTSPRFGDTSIFFIHTLTELYVAPHTPLQSWVTPFFTWHWRIIRADNTSFCLLLLKLHWFCNSSLTQAYSCFPSCISQSIFRGRWFCRNRTCTASSILMQTKHHASLRNQEAFCNRQ